MSLWSEIKRRNVFRVGAAYLIISWLIIQVAETVFPLFGFDDMPARMVVILLAIGFIPALLFAWAYELTPEGIKKEREVDREKSITKHTSRKLDRIIIGCLALAVAYFAFDKFLAPAEPPVDQGDEVVVEERSLPSIAVLPFVNMSANQDNEYFSDGLTETLLHILAQQPELKVAARTSSFYFKGKSIDVREIGQTLGVEHILEGSVQRAGDHVRITAQLVRVDDGFHVWSENFDRTLDDIFAIQDEIAGQVAHALNKSLGTPGHELRSLSTQNVDAYELFLRGLSQQDVFSYGSLGEAESLFKKAIAADTDFTEAKLALAWNYLLQSGTGLIPMATSLEQAAPLIEQARLDAPDLPMTRILVLAYSLYDAAVSFEVSMMKASISRLKEVLDEHPNQSFVLNMVVPFTLVLNDDLGLEPVVRRALEIDPLKPEFHDSMAFLLSMRGELEQAEQYQQRAIELAPENPNNYTSMAQLMERQNKLDQAIYWYVRASEIDPEDPELPMQIAQWLYAMDLPESGDAWAKRATAIAPHAPAAQRLKLDRVIFGGDDSEIELVARQVIAGVTEDRHWVVRTAAAELCRIHLERGTPEEAIDFLLGQYPAAADFSSFPEGGAAPVFAQIMVQMTRVMADPSLDREAIARQYTDNMRVMGLELTSDPAFQTWAHLLAGDLEAAAKTAAEGRLSEPWSMNPMILRLYGRPWYKQLTAFPEVQEKLADLERQRLQQRQATIEMLAREL